MYKKFFLPVSMLAGAIIGAGVFSLPYVLRPLGAGLAMFYIAVIAAALTLVHLLYADIVLRVPGNRNFVGLARLFFGRAATYLAVVMTVVQAFFVLLIYLALSASFAQILGITVWWGVYVFWALGSLTLFVNVRRFAAVEFVITAGMIAALSALFAWGARYGTFLLPTIVSIPALTFLLPIGPLLFSLSGRVSVAETVEYHRAIGFDARSLRRSIVWGTLVPAIFYAFFVAAIWFISGSPTADAVSGLSSLLPPALLMVVAALGLLSLFSSYIAVALNARNILVSDLRVSRFSSAALVVLIPAVLYATGIRDFLTLVGIAGGIFLSVEGIFILVMWRRAAAKFPVSAPLVRRVPGVVTVGLIALFAFALVGIFAK